MPTQLQTENKNIKKAQIVMVILTIILIVCLFTVDQWKLNLSKTTTISKGFGYFFFAMALGWIAVEKFLRHRFNETVWYIGWVVSIILGLLLCMGGNL